MKRKLTVRKLLQKAKNVPFTDIAFHREVYLNLPDELELNPHSTAADVLKHLEDIHSKFLDVKLEDILFEDEKRKTRCLVRWSYVIGLLSTFGTLVTMLYIALTTQTMPEGYLMAILVIVPGVIMWTQSGVLKSENASSVGKILSGLNPFSKSTSRRYHYDDEEEYTPTYQRKQSTYNDNDNGNPF